MLLIRVCGRHGLREGKATLRTSASAARFAWDFWSWILAPMFWGQNEADFFPLQFAKILYSPSDYWSIVSRELEPVFDLASEVRNFIIFLKNFFHANRCENKEVVTVFAQVLIAGTYFFAQITVAGYIYIYCTYEHILMTFWIPYEVITYVPTLHQHFKGHGGDLNS